MGEKLVIGYKLNAIGVKKPEYEHLERNIIDLFASSDTHIMSNCLRKVSTGITFNIPNGCVGFISGFPELALERGLVVVPDVIGHSYMFDLNIVMENHSVDDHDIKCGDKIARIVIVKPENAVLEEQR